MPKLLKIAPFVLLLSFLSFTTNAQIKQNSGSIIYDSDMGPDYDDVGALAVLHALADSGEVNLLATIASNRQPEKAQIFDVINTYFDHPDMPVGIPKGIAVERIDRRGWGRVLVKKFPHDIQSNAEVPGAVELYRRILSTQPDQSVTIVTVGFLTNMAKLLVSEPDSYSKLSGHELVSRKVEKLVSMAGEYPSGEEHNIVMDVASTDYVLEHWPTEIIFSGFKIGEKIKTGIPLINNEDIQDSPVKEAYVVSIPQQPQDKDGRMSWDQTAVLVAVRGAEPYYSLVPGRNTVDSNGENKWDYSGSGHFYMVEKKSVDYMQNLIDQLMMHQPE
ncbi:nucleoside hydrolase [Halalkalibaculum sp. DA3122]|uniref:nucleoside hydrolase n=1 Tax=Halalkalibaculum sp. DA3122 TaxID=3373607 RepID=UPI003754C85F